MGKTKYETIVEPNLSLVARWKRNGASDEEIAKRLGIAYSTFNLYKVNKSEFSEVLKKGKEIVDTEVENALLRRAIGFEYEEVTKERNDKGELVVTKVVKKHVVGDTTAQIFWLKNRCCDKWKDKHDVAGVEFKVDVPENIKKLSTEELRSLARQPAAPSTQEFTSGNNMEK